MSLDVESLEHLGVIPDEPANIYAVCSRSRLEFWPEPLFTKVRDRIALKIPVEVSASRNVLEFPSEQPT